MLKNIFAYLQYCLPQHLLTTMVGVVAHSRIHWLKNFLIRWFIKHYRVETSLALTSSLEDYPSFNAFFIRKIKPELRPISPGLKTLVSPVDGTMAQKGSVKNGQLLQAKNFYFTLNTLLANDPIANLFDGGSYATFYLAPRDYHRIHMPIDGHLKKSIYVPGNLFSVNKMTSEIIPNLYSRNERLITLFDTPVGPVIIILVGAMIVGSMQTVWMKQPLKSKKILVQDFQQSLFLPKGSELGYFQMGSTVIILLNKNTSIDWHPSLSTVQFGQTLGEVVDLVK